MPPSKVAFDAQVSRPASFFSRSQCCSRSRTAPLAAKILTIDMEELHDHTCIRSRPLSPAPGSLPPSHIGSSRQPTTSRLTGTRPAWPPPPPVSARRAVPASREMHAKSAGWALAGTAEWLGNNAMTRHANNVDNFARLCAITAQFETELLTQRLITSKHLPPRERGRGLPRGLRAFLTRPARARENPA